tara:strand:- start:29 stop:199 length:171 start_codon:yes stop_codon:yes gene_type:complete
LFEALQLIIIINLHQNADFMRMSRAERDQAQFQAILSRCWDMFWQKKWWAVLGLNQ